ncbi:TPA: phage tail protein [Pseudomonas putida]|nr:phage tail protein [Pseudomonas putida]
MPWYRTGTVAITAGQTTVTGTGTNFSANARVGDALLGPDGNWYEVTNIASGTVLSILPAYQGATVSGGSYAITPVQGYTKTLADKFNDIANAWGSTLAGLGSVSTENVVPVSKGGTGGTNQADARTGLGLKKAAVADIVGTVSQAGGVPTGALMEYVSNANGEAWKFACGLMICTALVTSANPATTSLGSLFTTGANPWIYPAAFSAPVVPLGNATLAHALIAGHPNGSTAGTGYWQGLTSYSVSSQIQARLVAIGRWFNP